MVVISAAGAKLINRVFAIVSLGMLYVPIAHYDPSDSVHFVEAALAVDLLGVEMLHAVNAH